MIRNLILVQDSLLRLVGMADGAIGIVSALQRLAEDASKGLACGGADNRIASYLLLCGCCGRDTFRALWPAPSSAGFVGADGGIV